VRGKRRLILLAELRGLFLKMGKEAGGGKGSDQEARFTTGIRQEER